MRIILADTPLLLNAAAALFREYANSLPFSLDYQGFEIELANLPGKYAPPAGAILLADVRNRFAGCVALRPLPDPPSWLPGSICEMKRFYVQPSARGLGVGKALVAAVLDRARNANYAAMVLDTSADMAAAQHVYQAAGFIPCDRYNTDPDPTTRYFIRDLAPPTQPTQQHHFHHT
jgi:GNAT superfamily N-acetyltransferase